MDVFSTNDAYDSESRLVEHKETVFAVFCNHCGGAGIMNHTICSQCRGIGRVVVHVFDGDQEIKPTQTRTD